MPAKNILDEEVWEKAKKAAGKGNEKKYALISHIYQKMGGRYSQKTVKKSTMKLFDLLKTRKEKREIVRLRNVLKAGCGKPKMMKKDKLEEGEHGTPPKEYKESGAKDQKDYAAPGYKYPIHTDDNAKAALSYFGKPENYNVYSKEERKTIAGKIARAAEKFKIEVSDEWKEKFGLKEKSIEKAKSIDSWRLNLWEVDNRK